jgi:hypothetical protein
MDNLLLLGGSLVAARALTARYFYPNEHSLSKHAFLGLYDDISIGKKGYFITIGGFFT